MHSLHLHISLGHVAQLNSVLVKSTDCVVIKRPLWWTHLWKHSINMFVGCAKQKCQMQPKLMSLFSVSRSVLWGETSQKKMKISLRYSFAADSSTVHLSVVCLNTRYLLEERGGGSRCKRTCLLCQSSECADNILSGWSSRSDSSYDSKKALKIQNQAYSARGCKL